jgi:hypothetical protein
LRFFMLKIVSHGIINWILQSEQIAHVEKNKIRWKWNWMVESETVYQILGRGSRRDCVWVHYLMTHLISSIDINLTVANCSSHLSQ